MSDTIRETALRKQQRWIAAMRRQNGGASVLVAMSGGVDSSIAAYLLSSAGLQVIGIHFRLLPDDAPVSRGACCHTASAADVTAVCDIIGASAQVWNLTEAFSKNVVEYFENSYLQGETPNPCIECNRALKWGILWDRRAALGVDFIATGHYARRIRLDSRYWFARGLDRSKDQAYALWCVPESRRAATLLPLGVFCKPEIRSIAADAGLPTAAVPESQDVCFLGATDYREWLRARHPAVFVAGLIRTTSGETVGRHNGVFGYTIGQRRGLGGGAVEPQYVVATDVATAEVIIGGREALLCKEVVVRRTVGEAVSERVLVQIRYRDAGAPARLYRGSEGRVRIRFETPVWAPAKGQSAAAFQGDRLVFGGIIDEIQ